jgi:branched-subunit amino acid aminotransferase/4-amino-4-deoxychorismate lyase
MHPVIYLNKNMVEASKARVAPVSAALLYGRGVFTSVAIYGGRPFLWSEHWARLMDHADRARVDRSGFSETGLATCLKKLIGVNRVSQGRARVVLLGGKGRDEWVAKGSVARKTDLLMMTADARRVPEEGLTLTVSPYRINSVSALTGVKSISTLDQILSWEEGRARDFDDVVMLNERGEVVCTAMANLFWVSEGTIHTPSLATGAVAGVTRARVITLAGELSIPLVEGVYELNDLADAEEVFLTSASIGVAPVTTYDFHRYVVNVGSVITILREGFRQLTLNASQGGHAADRGDLSVL